MATPLPKFTRDFPHYQKKYGIKLYDIKRFSNEPGALGMDADPTWQPQTGLSAGVPAVVTTEIDAQVIHSLVAPTKSEDIFGAEIRGDRTTRNYLFPVLENAGTTAAYGDFSQNGDSGANANWINRQYFPYQTWVKYGDLESNLMAAGQIQLVTEVRTSATMSLNKRGNLINLYGVEGLQNYGALNDPSLPPAIQPNPKAGANSATVTAWDQTEDPTAIYTDIPALFKQLNIQMMGNIDNSSKLVLVLPSELSQVLTYTNSFGITLEEMINKAYPNMKIKFLPEAGVEMSGGYNKTRFAMLFAEEVDGVRSVQTYFVDKLISHRLEAYSTHYRQKYSQASWGTVWKRPMACAIMVGI
ncbi:hypothetical protein RF55_19535 [Lasius niger]|uniref:DUF2184 domain-containing protein n=1 Tax=Lasius niger TaxID=67767 RepID=A0A0J7JZY3_LASNI|nr:hypothetical protein RF55_19535 [Lasius niger]